jgi:hypothetical protein
MPSEISYRLFKNRSVSVCNRLLLSIPESGNGQKDSSLVGLRRRSSLLSKYDVVDLDDGGSAHL